MAARCTACSTVFRVVPDQLRVSEGWVRCGRCAEVFNAAENLIDLDSGTPYRLGADGVLGLRTPTPAAAPTPAPASRQAPVGPAPTPSPAPAKAPPLPARPASAAAPSRTPAAGDAAAPHEQTAPFRREEVDAARQGPPPLQQDSRPPGRNDQVEPPGPPDAGDRFDDWAPLRSSSREPSMDPPTPDRAATFGPGMQAPGADRPPGNASAGHAAAAQPSFVRRAERAARWRRPRVRAAMATASAALALLLAWQLLFSQRDLAAARWPMARALLQPACAMLGCALEPPRLIDSLAVDSSGLLRVEKSDLYRLSVALRNRGAVDVLLPALDLTLTDAQGRLLARRVLRLQELGAAGSTLGAGKDLALQATVQAGAQPATPGSAALPGAAVAGYTIELFYP